MLAHYSYNFLVTKSKANSHKGQGWEQFTEGRSPDPGGKDPEECRTIDLKPKTFSDIVNRINRRT